MFIQPRVWSFYTASVLVGFGAAGNRIRTSRTSPKGSQNSSWWAVLVLGPSVVNLDLVCWFCGAVHLDWLCLGLCVPSAVDRRGERAGNKLHWHHYRAQQRTFLGSAAVQASAWFVASWHASFISPYGTGSSPPETESWPAFLRFFQLAFWEPLHLLGLARTRSHFRYPWMLNSSFSPITGAGRVCGGRMSDSPPTVGRP
jgi:hypothetical protein